MHTYAGASLHAQVHVRTHTLLPQTSQAGPQPLSGLLPCCSHSSPLLLLEVGTSYYAVAVAKRSSNLTINTLKGMRSCHTGINRTVGWNVPVGYLVESGSLSVMGCDVLKGEGFGQHNFSCGVSAFPLPLLHPCSSPHRTASLQADLRLAFPLRNSTVHSPRASRHLSGVPSPLSFMLACPLLPPF